MKGRVPGDAMIVYDEDNVDNCVLVDNQHYRGIPDSVRLNPGEFEMNLV